MFFRQKYVLKTKNTYIKNSKKNYKAWKIPCRSIEFNIKDPYYGEQSEPRSREWTRDSSQLPQMRAFSQTTFLPACVLQVLVPVSDWWDKSNVTWFLRGGGGQTNENICHCKKSRSSLFFLDNRKWRTFHLKDKQGRNPCRNSWLYINFASTIIKIIVSFR